MASKKKTPAAKRKVTTATEAITRLLYPDEVSSGTKPKKTLKKDVKPKKVKKVDKTFEVRLTKLELLHMRDLFSILLPPDAKMTVSQSLADAENRLLTEAVLWKKLSTVINQAGIEVDDEAPDFIVATISQPSMGVFQLAHEPNQQPGGREPDSMPDVFSVIGGHEEEDDEADDGSEDD